MLKKLEQRMGHNEGQIYWTDREDLDQVEEGDKITVTYTGRVSRVDPFHAWRERMHRKEIFHEM